LGLASAWVAAVLALAPMAVVGSAQAAEATTASFGATQDGRPIRKTTLRNDRGMVVSAIDYGATLTAIETPDRRGVVRNLLLSQPAVAGYETTQRRYAATIGRYAGRIGGARFALDGKVFELEPGKNGATLHGGSRGYDKRVWGRQSISDRRSVGVRFTLVSPDGDQGFPGRLEVSVTYRLMRRSNELRIEYAARTDAPTVINLTNHGFFNLAGAGQGDVLGQRVWIDADRYAEVDQGKIPTGQSPSVKGTVLDFQTPALIGARLKPADPLLASSQGFDHSLVFRTPGGPLRRVAWMEDPASGRRMEISTTEPSVQFNSGNGFDGGEIGSEGVAYRQHDGFAFETQHLPDSPNRPNFPSTTLRPGMVFHSTTVLRFTNAG
jgi:aldose 1-epimerase